MATLRKRKNKNGKIVFLVDFYLNGKRFVRSTKTDDPKTAKLILKDIEAKIAKNTFNVEDISPKKKVYLKQFKKEYLEYSENHKAYKTFLRDELSFKNFLNFLGNKSLDSIDSKQIDQYLNSRAKEVKKSTANIELRHLKAGFNKAIQWNYIDNNPFKGIKPFNLPKNAPIFFKQEEIDILLDTIDIVWLKQIVIFAINTGVRIGELTNLEWEDISLKERTIKISNKNDFTTKSKKERVIPINDDLFDLLKNLSKDHAYVFSTGSGEKRDPEFVSKKFKKYVRKAELGEQYTFHSLRHTFASHLVQKGVSLYIVSKLLGHSDLKTTEIYAHLAPETFLDVVNILNFQKKSDQEIRSASILKLQKYS